MHGRANDPVCKGQLSRIAERYTFKQCWQLAETTITCRSWQSAFYSLFATQLPIKLALFIDSVNVLVLTWPNRSTFLGPIYRAWVPPIIEPDTCGFQPIVTTLNTITTNLSCLNFGTLPGLDQDMGSEILLDTESKIHCRTHRNIWWSKSPIQIQ